MRKPIRFSVAAALTAAAVIVAPASHARDGISSMFHDPMMGPGIPVNMTGMMNMMGHMDGMMGQMGGMMNQCRQMMQDRQGNSGKPNDQWREAPPKTPANPDKKE